MRIRNALQKNAKNDAMDLFSSLVNSNEECSNATRRFEDFIFDWWTTVENQRWEWSRKVIAKSPKDAGSGYYLPHFHRFALRGVLDILEVLVKHWDGDISWRSWSARE